MDRTDYAEGKVPAPALRSIFADNDVPEEIRKAFSDASLSQHILHVSRRLNLSCLPIRVHCSHVLGGCFLMPLPPPLCHLSTHLSEA